MACFGHINMQNKSSDRFGLEGLVLWGVEGESVSL